MIIKITDLVIECNLLYLNEFESIHKYEVKDIPSYYINSLEKEFNKELLTNLIKETTYYDLYSYNDKIYQVQHDLDNKFLGIIEYDNNIVNIYNTKGNSFQREYLLSQYAIMYLINKYSNSILFHSSTIKYNNLGIAFSAKSGTGKSTHRRLWMKYTDAKTINDDKNIITLKDDKLYIYPNPWSGKHMIDNDIVQELNAIVFLYQNKENVIEKLKPFKAMKLLLGQIELPTEENRNLWDKITDKLLEIPTYYYGCNMEKEAVDVVKERIEKDLCQ